MELKSESLCMVLFQDKLIKLHESLTDLHEKILKSTGKDVEVENIKIIEFCPMQETGDGQDEVNGDHVLKHEDREKRQSEKTKAADEEITESKEGDDKAKSSKSQNDLNEERETDSRDRKKKVSHNFCIILHCAMHIISYIPHFITLGFLAIYFQALLIYILPTRRQTPPGKQLVSHKFLQIRKGFVSTAKMPTAPICSAL
ncbi:uncharacterized protein LOC110840123 [Zootermopsis nevadensis]|uniref:uncharacterized protein LOC110840123 n=1 Tax=Zootermopsis nevadensis TaxID=136037 RepID=UPI000B8E78C0|nr:uncharacterized protein LOC110840123 [Zootermopsis nevadensis]